MKFKIDENLPLEFATVLHEAGFDAATVSDETLSGALDTALLERCRAETRVLISLDLDFANIQTQPAGTHPGIIVFRSRSQDKVTLISLLRRMLPTLRQRSPVGQLWIVQADRIRFREE